MCFPILKALEEGTPGLMLARWNVYVGMAAAGLWKDVPCSLGWGMLFWPAVCDPAAHSFGSGTFYGGASCTIQPKLDFLWYETFSSKV